MSRTTFATLALAAGTVFVATSASQADLVHRYDLNGNGNDSVGTSDGTALANGTFTATGFVTDGITTSGTSGLSLPSSAVAGLNGSFTIQQFYTSAAPQGNFAVGSSFSDRGAITPADPNATPPVLANPSGTTNFLIYQPHRGDAGNPSSFAATGPNIAQHNFLGATNDAAGTTYDVLFTYDAGSGNASYYVDGVLSADPSATFSIAGFDLSTKNAQIGINGNGPFLNDPSLNGTTDEFRIFNNSVTAAQAATLNSLGANASTAAINAAVPEPVSLGLLGLGGLGLLTRRRRTA